MDVRKPLEIAVFLCLLASPESRCVFWGAVCRPRAQFARAERGRCFIGGHNQLDRVPAARHVLVRGFRGRQLSLCSVLDE